MRTYQVKQKFRLGGERFDIKDELGNVEYQVEGSFLKIPKTFTIYDKNGRKLIVFLVIWLTSCPFLS